MRKGDTRGLSTIVATLLIILLTLVAVGIVWGVIRNIIVNNSEQISLSQFTINLEIINYTSSGQNLNIQVKRNPGEGDIQGIIFSISNGTNTDTCEKSVTDWKPLITKNFVCTPNLKGKIVSVSIYPTFITSSGKIIMGNIADTYYGIGNNEGELPVSPECVSNCSLGVECGDDGCAGSCGTCSGSTPNCNVSGMCTRESVSGSNCACSANTCEGRTCRDTDGESCFGAILKICTDGIGQIFCGNSTNNCGSCADCESGMWCDQGTCCGEGYHSLPGERGTCSQDCNILDCGLRECGSIPNRLESECGINACGQCSVEEGTCNETNGRCEVCQPNCDGKECGTDGCGGFCGDISFNGNCNILLEEKCNQLTWLCEECQDDCGLRECGSVPNNCGASCGNCISDFGPTYTCNQSNWLCEVCQPNCDGKECGTDGCGGFCGDISFNGDCNKSRAEFCDEGKCYNESRLNEGTIFSVWPWPIGRMYFDSEDLPILEVNYFGKFVKIKEGLQYFCFPILEFYLPDPERESGDYSKSYMRISYFSTYIEPGNSYEIWETYDGCKR